MILKAAEYAERVLMANQDMIEHVLSFDRGLRTVNIGFWIDVTKKHLPETDLLIQGSNEALADLVEASSLPVFNSDRIMEIKRMP